MGAPDNNFGLNEIGKDTDNGDSAGTDSSIAGYLRAMRDAIVDNGISSGSGVKATASAPSYDEASTDSFSSDLSGNLRVIDAAVLTALAGLLNVQTSFPYTNISGAGSTLVKTGAGVLRSVTVNTKGTVASTVKVYDGTDSGGTLIATIDSLNLSGQFQYDIAFTTGLFIVATGTSGPDLTVSSR